MADVASPPTARALDVVEMLANAGGQHYRLSEIAEALGLSISTAHNILSTLVVRGWAVRDAIDKTFTVGPVLDITAAAAVSPRGLARRAQALTVELAARLDCAASVVERSGEELVITCFESMNPGPPETTPGEFYPYSPPFGFAFAAWDTQHEQDAWVERGAAGNDELAFAADVADEYGTRADEGGGGRTAVQKAAFLFGHDPFLSHRGSLMM